VPDEMCDGIHPLIKPPMPAADNPFWSLRTASEVAAFGRKPNL
jgi:hypothetical protein